MRPPLLSEAAKTLTGTLLALVLTTVLAPRLGLGGLGLVFWLGVLTPLAMSLYLGLPRLRRWRQAAAGPSQATPRTAAGPAQRASTWLGRLGKSARSHALRTSLIVAPPLIGTLDILLKTRGYGSAPLPFMADDMVMNTIEAVTIHLNGGQGTGDEVKPVFLTAAISSLFHGPGTTFPSLSTLLTGNVAAAGTVCALTSLLLTSTASHLVDGVRGPLQALGVLAVGWVPYTGLSLGLVLRSGYMNIPVIFLNMVLAWVLYRTLSSWEALPWLAVLVLTSLATWSPAALLPGMLLLIRLVQALAGWGRRRPTRAETVRTAASWLLLAAYVLLVALPSLRQDGDYLTSGPVVDFHLVDRLVLAATGLLILIQVLAFLVRPRVPQAALGLTGMALGGWGACVYLLSLREWDDPRWGYYPVKMMTITVVVVGAVLGLEALVAFSKGLPTGSGRARRYLYQAATASVTVAALACATLVPQYYAGLRRSLAPLHQPVLGVPTVEDTDLAAYEDLLRVFDAAPGAATVYIKENPDLSVDADRNRFLIQFSAPTSRDVRIHAYTAWGPHYYSMLCPLLEAWDREATVITSAENLAQVTQDVQDCLPRHRVSVVTTNH